MGEQRLTKVRFCGLRIRSLRSRILKGENKDALKFVLWFKDSLTDVRASLKGGRCSNNQEGDANFIR